MTTSDSLVQMPGDRSQRTTLHDAVIRFSGDSGDGMQLTGTQFTQTAARLGNDTSTFPDFPAEIRAPAGTTFGVSGFQIHFSDHRIYTPGDHPDVLVAMNPAALKVNLPDLKPSGILILNEDAFTANNLEKAGYTSNPLEDGSLTAYRSFSIHITTQVEKIQSEGSKLSFKEIGRTKNFWTLGLIYYLYSRPLEPTLEFIDAKFRQGELADANRRALKAGYLYGEVAELFQETYEVRSAQLQPGTYRNVTGNQATAWGAIAAAEQAGVPLFYGSYPITPASDVLHELSRHKSLGVRTMQAEDEIAAVTASIGASFGGMLALTGSSGPGIALKTEGLGLAVSAELPLVVLNVQRGGPSTGLPTKTEQADLLQAIYGRNGECPIPVLAAATPSDCFRMMVESFRIALKYMTPVILLTDGYLANGSEPWRLPEENDLPKIEARFAEPSPDFHPFLRDPDTLARVWPLPGRAGLEHRIGGLEKNHDSGHISYDPDNHERMIQVRQTKVDRVAHDGARTEIFGPRNGKVLLLGWGSTYGAIRQAVHVLREQGREVSHAHVRHLNPLPADLGDVLAGFEQVLVPEMNLGQLRMLVRANYLVPAQGLSKVKGKPFAVEEIVQHVQKMENDA
ncbi:MAG: 2-oxoacid:acceptor oxidoreductase subunit alpha [Myxococcota bacterium]